MLASSRRAFAALAAALPLLTQCAPEPPGEAVIVVLLDTFRRDALGCYGGPEGATPHLDALARECVTFRDAVSPSGWTLPSTASLLTGAWPTVHGGMGKDVELTPVRADVPLDQVLRHFDHLIAIAGEDRVGFGSDFDGAVVPKDISDVSGLPNLRHAMREHGYDEALMTKLCHGNWLRVLEKTWGP